MTKTCNCAIKQIIKKMCTIIKNAKVLSKNLTYAKI